MWVSIAKRNQNAQYMTETLNETLKNGLTQKQVEKARELFSKVNLSAICRENNIHYMTIANVLRDRNNNIEAFNKVVTAAKEKVDKNEEALKSLPL